MQVNDVVAYIQARKERFVADLKEWLTIPSDDAVSPLPMIADGGSRHSSGSVESKRGMHSSGRVNPARGDVHYRSSCSIARSRTYADYRLFPHTSSWYKYVLA